MDTMEEDGIWQLMEYMESCNKWKCLEIAAEYGNCKNTVRMEYDGNMDTYGKYGCIM